jgi:hypothetical protein
VVVGAMCRVNPSAKGFTECKDSHGFFSYYLFSLYFTGIMGEKNEILLWRVLKNRMPITVSIFLGLKYSVNSERKKNAF